MASTVSASAANIYRKKFCIQLIIVLAFLMSRKHNDEDKIVFYAQFGVHMCIMCGLGTVRLHCHILMET